MAERLLKHVVGMEDIGKGSLLEIMAESPEMELVANSGGSNQLAGKLFYLEFRTASKLTRETMISAIVKLGGHPEGPELPERSLWSEMLEDRVRSIANYGYNASVLRLPNIGDAKKVADVSRIPVINGGEFGNGYDNFGEHPLQAIADLQTIHEVFPYFRDLNIVVAGYGFVTSHPAVNSILVATSWFKGVNLTIASAAVTVDEPKNAIETWLKEHGITIPRIRTNEELKRALRDADVLYLPQLLDPKTEANIRRHNKNGFQIDDEVLSYLPSRAIILHGMRQAERPPTALHKQASWDRQEQNNLSTKMVLLTRIDYKRAA